MFEFITVVLAISAVAFVAMPFLKNKNIESQHQSETQSKLNGLLHQNNVLQNMIEDLEFDYQTGKLSTADYDALVSEHKKAQSGLDARIKVLGGVSSEELTAQLEDEIAIARQKISPVKVKGCAQCNRPINRDDKFCSNCGAQV